MERGASRLGNLETQSRWLAGIFPAQGLRGSDRAAGSLVTRWPFFRRGHRSSFLQLFFAAKTVVCGASLEQLCCGRTVQMIPLGLIIRSFIPVNSEPGQA